MTRGMKKLNFSESDYAELANQSDRNMVRFWSDELLRGDFTSMTRAQRNHLRKLDVLRRARSKVKDIRLVLSDCGLKMITEALSK